MKYSIGHKWTSIKKDDGDSTIFSARDYCSKCGVHKNEEQVTNLVKNSEQMPKEFTKIVNDNFDELIK